MSKGRLYGTAEIGDRLGVTRQRAYVITRTKGFPEPYDELQMGNVWLITDVERWIKANRPDVAEDAES